MAFVGKSQRFQGSSVRQSYVCLNRTNCFYLEKCVENGIADAQRRLIKYEAKQPPLTQHQEDMLLHYEDKIDNLTVVLEVIRDYLNK